MRVCARAHREIACTDTYTRIYTHFPTASTSMQVCACTRSPIEPVHTSLCVCVCVCVCVHMSQRESPGACTGYTERRYWGTYYSVSITERIVSCRSQEKRGQQERTINHRPQQGKLHCIVQKKSASAAAQPVRNHHHPELLLFSRGLWFKTPPPSPPTSPQNNVPSFVWRTYYGFARFACPKLQFSVLPNKPVFAGENNCLLLCVGFFFCFQFF